LTSARDGGGSAMVRSSSRPTADPASNTTDDGPERLCSSSLLGGMNCSSAGATATIAVGSRNSWYGCAATMAGSARLRSRDRGAVTATVTASDDSRDVDNDASSDSTALPLPLALAAGAAAFGCWAWAG
jgi:hypothetical protein